MLKQQRPEVFFSAPNQLRKSGMVRIECGAAASTELAEKLRGFAFCVSVAQRAFIVVPRDPLILDIAAAIQNMEARKNVYWFTRQYSEIGFKSGMVLKESDNVDDGAAHVSDPWEVSKTEAKTCHCW